MQKLSAHQYRKAGAAIHREGSWERGNRTKDLLKGQRVRDRRDRIAPLQAESKTVVRVYFPVKFVGYVEAAARLKRRGRGVCGNVIWLTALFLVILLIYI
jgi:hypothetical protein